MTTLPISINGGALWACIRSLLGILIAVYVAPGQMFALLTNYSDRGWYYGLIIAIMILPTYFVIGTVATTVAMLSSQTVVLKYILYETFAFFSLFILYYFSLSAFNNIKRFFSPAGGAIPAPVFKRLDLLKTRGGTGTQEVDEPGLRTAMVANLTCITNPYVVGILLFTVMTNITQEQNGLLGSIVNVAQYAKDKGITYQQALTHAWSFTSFILCVLLSIAILYSVIAPVYFTYGVILYFARWFLGQWFYFWILYITIFFLGCLMFTMMMKIICGPDVTTIIKSHGAYKAGLSAQFFPTNWAQHTHEYADVDGIFAQEIPLFNFVF